MSNTPMLKSVTREELDEMIVWVREFLRSIGITRVLLNMSGGSDSCAAMYILVEALGAENVLCLCIPIGSSEHALIDAHRLCELVGVRCIDRALDRTFATLMEEAQLPESTPRLDALSDEDREKAIKVAKGNVKARLRTTVGRLWAEMNGYLFVNTCNWSETIVGYDTKGGGDADGDFGPLQQFVKSDVWAILRMLGAPQWIIDKVPSADLEGEDENGQRQSDEADLDMTYETLDTFARVFAVGGEEAVLAMEDINGKRERFLQLMRRSRHKRAAMPVFQREGFNFLGD